MFFIYINILIALLLEFNTSNTHVGVSIIVPSQYTYKWYHCSPFEENCIPPLLLVSSLCVPLPPKLLHLLVQSENPNSLYLLFCFLLLSKCNRK